MTAKIIWPMDGPRQRHWPAADDVLRLCGELTDRFRRRAPMPIVVLQARRPEEDPGPPTATQVHQVDRLVADLHQIYRAGRLLCEMPAVPDDSPSVLPHPIGKKIGEYHDALALVRVLSTSASWDNARQSQYRRYSFPRSQLLAKIEAAVEAEIRDGAAGSVRPDEDPVLDRLTRPRLPTLKRGKSPLTALRAVWTVAVTIFGGVLTVVAAALITPELARWLLVFIGTAIVVSWLVELVRQGFAAPLSWLNPAIPWFTTSTFILADDDDPPGSEPVPRWRRLTARWPGRVRDDRARMVVRQVIAAYYGPPRAGHAWQDGPAGDSLGDTKGPGLNIPPPDDPAADGGQRESAMRFCLSLRVHALLLDLRSNYRPWSLGLRHQRQSWPPMVFLPAADTARGGIGFLQAVSDLRSRRSETDPLLIVASSGPGSLRDRPESVPADGRLSTYDQWISRLRIEQSPSLESQWPWVLRYPVWTDRLSSQSLADPDQPLTRWSGWGLWPRLALALVVVLLIAGGLWRNQVLASEYCDGGLFGYDRNLVLIGGECIGTETANANAFVPPGGGVTLGGTVPAREDTPAVGSRVSLSQVSLAYLEELIDVQNRVAQSGPHVTFVYAGALTGPDGSLDPQDDIEELAGVYAWQYNIDTALQDHVKVSIDIANAGDGSAEEGRMAQTIVAAARQDPTITGVIGLGIDTSQSATAIGDLAQADLPVIDTTNSDDTFPGDWNYFGLSPTNAEEAAALVRRFAGRGHGRHAVVFERVGNNGHATDPYAEQQASGARAALTNAGFQLAGAGPISYTPDSDLADSTAVEQDVCAVHPSVVYLAGRHEDMSQLVSLLDARKTCFAANVTVLSGDDMTFTEYRGTRARLLAPRMTLYYVAQTDPAHVGPGDTDNGSSLNGDLQIALNLATTPDYTNSILANGLVALGFDAADVLYRASTTDSGLSGPEQALPRSSVAPGLRCPKAPVSGGATGPLGFADVRHGLDFFKAVNATNGPRPQDVTYLAHQATLPGRCAHNVAP
jgi:hypothetical protein